MVLDPWIIEEIKRKEEERRREQDRSRLHQDIPSQAPPGYDPEIDSQNNEPTLDEEDTGYGIVIDFAEDVIKHYFQ